MSALSIQVPFPVFQDRDGQPLENGYVWIGVPNLNPQTNPVVAYYDAALTIVAAQPLRTLNGYISRAGSPAQIYVDGVNFSILVQDSKGSMVYNFPDGTGISPDACGITYDPPFAGSVPYPVCEKLAQTVSVKDFGAVGNGVADDTIAIQTALNSASARSVFIPAGVYNVTSLTMPDGASLVGEGSYSSVLRETNASVTTILAGISNTIKDLKFISSVTRTNSIYINISGNGCLVEKCEFDNYYIGVSVGAIADPITVNARVFDCAFRSSNTTLGSGAIQYLHYSNAQVANCVITGTTVSSIQPTFGIRFQNGDTAFVTDCNVTVHGKALLVDTPAGLNCFALTIVSSIFDSAHQISGGVAVSNAEIGGAGSVFNTKISNSWFGLASTKNGCHLLTSGSGFVDGITFTGCEFTDNGENGLLADGANIKDWFVTGGHSGGNAASGIRCAAGTNYFTITGHRAGNISGRGPNNFGISLDTAAEGNYVIADNNLVSNASGAINDGSTGANGQIFNNLGYNNATPPFGLTVGASPWTYVAGHTPEQIFISGGTVSQIRVSAQIVQSASPAVIQLSPNDELIITYSSLPTVLKKVM